MLNIKYTYKKKVTKHPLLVIHRHTVYLLSMRPLCGGMGMLPVALSLPLAEDCASKKEKKKVAGDICFPEKKKRKEKKTLILPTGVRDGAGDRPQLSPAAPIGWQFVQNPSQTTSLTTHQQILKAYMQPPPSPLRCCRTASKPDAAARRLTFLRTLPSSSFSSSSSSAPALAWFSVFFDPPGRRLSAADFYYFSCKEKASRQRTLPASIAG